MKRILSIGTFVLCQILTVYALISKFLFDKVYKASDNVVDEEFHLPLGMAYCRKQYDKWDPKVTTLPGLYLWSSIFAPSEDYCNVYWLRLSCLFAAIINIPLFYILLRSFDRSDTWKTLFSALNIALLPPLYFFSFLYYTDVPSLMITVGMVCLGRGGHHFLASFFGFLAIVMRQTNVIWVFMVFGGILCEKLIILQQGKPKLKNKIVLADLWGLFKATFRKPLTLLKSTDVSFWLDLLPYIIVIFSFILFVVLNGGIVVGDRNAHKATVHIPQLFYFSLFNLFFAWPFFLSEVQNFLKFVLKKKLVVTVLAIIMSFVIYFNTQVHPYMLADNRHYIFYIWNRFYGNYTIFKYLMIPVYIFSMYSLLNKVMQTHDVPFTFFYILSSIVVLIPQRLIELRYFILPFILFRVQLRNVTFVQLLLEFFNFIVINAITLYIFFNKDISWTDYKHPQKLIW